MTAIPDPGAAGALPLPDLSGHSRIAVLTGAGISVASGLPTYWGKGGLWEKADVGRYATAAAMAADPARVWSFFASLRAQVARAAPNAAHLALAELGRRLGPGRRLTVITQNVDGLHSLAGSEGVLELHGTLQRSRCTACKFSREERPETAPVECPMCPECGRPLRPDVVLFDEPLPVRAAAEARRAVQGCDLFLAVGTSGTVFPAAEFVAWASNRGARTMYVNAEPMTPANPAFQDVCLGKAEVLLPELIKMLSPE